uniref:Peptidase_M14 domain-containing protein n=1 Tax=Wuchereria bancrofti TaxID=6293 RepID=A0A1I8EX10_WUCBA
MLAIFAVLFTVLHLRYMCSAIQQYRGYSLLRFPTATTDWLDQIEADSLVLNNANVINFLEPKRILVDIWAKPNMYRNHADVLVAPEYLDSFLALLRMRGVSDIQIVANDIQKEIDRERRDLAYAMKYRSRRSVGDNSLANFNLIAYHRYDEIVDYLRKLSRLHPNLAEIFNVTKTYEGRDLIGIKIGSRSSFKPAIFIDAGIHAREWIAPAVALYIITKLVTEYGKDSNLTHMTDKFDWYIVPVANPDGYEYSMTTDRLWRKTRSRNVTVNKWCVGADANRNWGYRWGEAGASRSPCSNIYPGSTAFSEVYVSLHSYGQLFLAPWGYTNDRPNNYYDQKQAASLAVEAIRKRTDPASGTSIDYMQDKGVPYIYGIELRPEDADNNFGFTIPARFIEPTGQLVTSALALGKYVPFLDMSESIVGIIPKVSTVRL